MPRDAQSFEQHDLGLQIRRVEAELAAAVANRRELSAQLRPFVDAGDFQSPGYQLYAGDHRTATATVNNLITRLETLNRQQALLAHHREWESERATRSSFSKRARRGAAVRDHGFESKGNEEPTPSQQKYHGFERLTIEDTQAVAATLQRIERTLNVSAKILDAAGMFATITAVFDTLEPTLELKTIQGMSNKRRQDEMLEQFSATDAVISFFHEGQVPDLRFSNIVPNPPAPYRTAEAPSLARLQGANLIRSATGSGKTTAMLDMGCHHPLIYVVCHGPTPAAVPSENLQEITTSDALFPLLVTAINSRCVELMPSEGHPAFREALGMLKEEGRRLVMVDICARLSFFLWMQQTFGRDLTPENALLAQLSGGRRHMAAAFDSLFFAHPTSLQALAKYCFSTLTSNLSPEQIRVALDEAQMAAHMFGDERGFHFTLIEHADVARGLLYQYTLSWKLLDPAAFPIIITGTDLTSDTEGRLPSDIEKPTMHDVRLPFLDIRDVIDRLRKMLNTEGIEWAAIHNITNITGRCRWVASLIHQLSVTENKRAAADKSLILRNCITAISTRAAANIGNKIYRNLRRGQGEATIARLVKRLHAAAWLFADHTQGMRLRFNEQDFVDLLALGLVLRVPSDNPGSVDVAMDTIACLAVQQVAERSEWNPSAIIAGEIAAELSTSIPVELGYRFETLVAAAIVRYSGTVAELIRTVNGGEDPPDMPAWTEDARFKCKYRVCGSPMEVQEAVSMMLNPRNPSSLDAHDEVIHPDDMMRPDIFGVMRSASPLPFLLTGSAKCYTARLSDPRRAADLESTLLEKVYTSKPNSEKPQNEAKVRAAKLDFANQEYDIAELVQLRVLRIHAILPGYAAERRDGRHHELPRILIEGNAVRLVIDKSNFPALFGDPRHGLGACVTRICELKKYDDIKTERK